MMRCACLISSSKNEQFLWLYSDNFGQYRVAIYFTKNTSKKKYKKKKKLIRTSLPYGHQASSSRRKQKARTTGRPRGRKQRPPLPALSPPTAPLMARGQGRWLRPPGAASTSAPRRGRGRARGVRLVEEQRQRVAAAEVHGRPGGGRRRRRDDEEAPGRFHGRTLGHDAQ